MSTVVLSYGLGVDSSAILARWLTDPSSRDFDLRDLVVITAQVGHEFPDSKRLVEAHMLPLLRAAGVRYVQVARSGPSTLDWRVLDDSREPTTCHTEGGGYTLADEMLAAGTVPQKGGARLCSQKFKGVVLDAWIEGLLGGASYRHVIGFEANELGRVERDSALRHDAASPADVRVGRHPEYPLLTWGWDRARCEEYLRGLFGEPWQKSCCTFCPFADNVKNLPSHVRRLQLVPELAAVGALMERASLALNPRQPLYTVRGTYQAVVVDPSPAIGAALDRKLDTVGWAVYRVRRAWTRNKLGKAQCAARDVERVVTGDRAWAEDALARLASSHGRTVEVDGDRRTVTVTPKPALAGREECFVIAPAVMGSKQGPAFRKAWAAASLLDDSVYGVAP